MKKIFAILSILAANAYISLMAAPVTPERALEVAGKILNGERSDGLYYGALHIVWTGNEPQTKAIDNVPFYVISSDGGGFVIIAGDDNVRPVLAISERGIFVTEDMPDNVKWWMDEISRYVRSATSQSARVKEMWDAYTATKSGVIDGAITNKVGHLTPEWNQGDSDMYYFGKQVFNRFCPLQNGQLTITGCVATALAEILTVHSGLYPDKMPLSGTGTVGGYEPGYGVAPDEYELGIEYNWAALRTLTNTEAIMNASEDVLDNLAHLMADLGAMCKASYAVNGTGAYSEDAMWGVVEHLGYNKSAYIENPRNYSRSQWERKLSEELAQRPVYYAGNGHAFVFDGYGDYYGDRVFHVNFGWGGSCNGYYYYTNLDTGSSIFSTEWNEVMFDFYPEPESNYSYRVVMGSWWGGTGLYTDSDIEVGNTFSLHCNGIANHNSAVRYSGTVRASLKDKNGVSIIEDIGSKNFTQDPYYGDSNFTLSCIIPEGTSIKLGDKIVLECTTNEEGTVFEQVQYPLNGSMVGELPVFPATFIHKESNYYKGDSFEFILDNCNTAYAGTEWQIISPSGSYYWYSHSEGAFRLKESGTYTIIAHIRESNGSEIIENVGTKLTVK